MGRKKIARVVLLDGPNAGEAGEVLERESNGTLLVKLEKQKHPILIHESRVKVT